MHPPVAFGPLFFCPSTITPHTNKDISHLGLPLPKGTDSERLSGIRWLTTTATCMDRSQRDRNDHLRQQRANQRGNRSSQQSAPHRDRRSAYLTSEPTPQREGIPFPDQPCGEQRQTSFSVSQYPWRLRLYEEIPQTSPVQRRRPGLLQNDSGQRAFDGYTPHMGFLYPQASPYADNRSSLSAPDETDCSHRSVRQPNTPRWQDSRRYQGSRDLATLPRAPTYPPPSRRRIHNMSNPADVTFTDEEEFHLFAQATAGLGPQQTIRHSYSSSGSSQILDTNTREHQALPPGSHQHPSPIQETPTTMYALQQLAQLPQTSPAMQYRGTGPSLPAHSQRLIAGTANVDSWLLPPEDPYDAYDAYDDGGMSTTMDDELPDYAASQAQAQIAQRVEAARRAQELQRRWQQSR